MKIKKNKPNYKGYIRSGAILFNNINQHNTKDAKTPKARRRNDNSLPAQSDVFANSSGQMMEKGLMGRTMYESPYTSWS